MSVESRRAVLDRTVIVAESADDGDAIFLRIQTMLRRLDPEAGLEARSRAIDQLEDEIRPEPPAFHDEPVGRQLDELIAEFSQP
jgi:hypothetical protein